MKRPVLVRIPWSHFCVKAEWGLSQAGIAYDTWDIGFRRAARLHEIHEDGTVPILFVDGELISGSDRILTWAAERQAPGTDPLYPEAIRAQVQEWETWAGEAVGPMTRRDAYRVVYNQPSKVTRNPLLHAVLRIGHSSVLPILKFYKVRRFDEADREAAPKIIDNVATELDRQGTGYLVGDRPTAADHAVAALIRPLTWIVAARDYRSLPGWPAVVAHIARVKPARSTRKRRRRMTKKKWRRLVEAG